ncbi:MAG: hypothetical protein ACYDBQ_02260 [Thermoplasmatota archaeon]
MRFLAVVAVALMTGCASPGAPPGPALSWRMDPCDSSGATTISGNAPLVAAFRGPAKDIAATMLDVVGDRWTNATPSGDSNDWRWETRDGFLQVTLSRTDTENPIAIHYATLHGALFNATSVATMLGKLGVDVANVTFSPFGVRGTPTRGAFAQTFGGVVLYATGGTFLPGRGDPAPPGWSASLRLTALRDLGRAEVKVTPEAAVATARAYSRCSMDHENRTAEAGYQQGPAGPLPRPAAFLYDSLAYEVYVTYNSPRQGPCPEAQDVAVDAATGAVLGLLQHACQ